MDEDFFGQTVQAQNQGASDANAASYGTIPNVSQPKGSPQLYTAAMDKIRGEILELNSCADILQRNGLEKQSHKVIKAIGTLQEVVMEIQSLMQEQMQAQIPNQF